MRISLLVLCLCLICAAGQVKATAAAPWKVATIMNIQPTHPVVQRVDQAYRQLGLSMQLELMAAERIKVELQKGELLDATLAAGLIFGEDKPHLIRIPVSVYQMQLCAFSTDADLQISQWQQLQPYSVLYIQGQITVKTRLEQHQLTQAEGVLSLEQALRRAAVQRGQAAVLPCTEAQQVLTALDLKAALQQSPPLETVELYHYIHQKHRMWLQPLTQALATTAKDQRVEAHE